MVENKQQEEVRSQYKGLYLEEIVKCFRNLVVLLLFWMRPGYWRLLNIAFEYPKFSLTTISSEIDTN
ncbi:hypothetical protein P8452_76332 [Trifolium repens]|nr:hypothetical protein P8452_61360 [Trifolium repens]WJX94962.1 hypothetical protein P8452_76332 [Trifolium repens]